MTLPRPAPPPKPSSHPSNYPERSRRFLLTLDKPVAARRLAEALGLAPPEEPGGGADEVKVVRRTGGGRGKTGADGVRAVEEAVAALKRSI